MLVWIFNIFIRTPLIRKNSIPRPIVLIWVMGINTFPLNKSVCSLQLGVWSAKLVKPRQGVNDVFPRAKFRRCFCSTQDWFYSVKYYVYTIEKTHAMTKRECEIIIKSLAVAVDNGRFQRRLVQRPWSMSVSDIARASFFAGWRDGASTPSVRPPRAVCYDDITVS